jgi:hypothetical protein
MFEEKFKLYSSYGNRLKKLNKIRYHDKIMENKYHSYLDKDGFEIKLKYEIEKEKKLFNQFIHNMRNYQKVEEEKRKNYLSKMKGYKDMYEENKIIELRRRRLKDILDLKKRKEYIDTKISLLNTTSLPSNIGYYLLGGKNRNYKNTKEIFLNNINNTNENIRKNNLKKINYQALLPLNISHNSENTNNSPKQLQFLDSNNYNIMTKIIRRRVHPNFSSSFLWSPEKKINLIHLKIKGNDSSNKLQKQLLSQKDTNTTNINSNETNSMNLNSTNNTNKINSYNNKINNMKSSVKNYYFYPNDFHLNVTKLNLKNKSESKYPVSLDKIMDRNNISYNNNEMNKLNSDFHNNISKSLNDSNQSSLVNNKRWIKLKKIGSLKLSNHIINNESNSLRDLDKEKK